MKQAHGRWPIFGRVEAMVSLAAVLAALLGAAAAHAASHHSNPCHMRHTCPSDHHSYIWTDTTGEGWDCARPGTAELRSADNVKITYEGLPYFCHAFGATGSSGGSIASGSAASARSGAATRGSGVARSAPSSGPAGETEDGGDSCGVERWAVKVASDPLASKIVLVPRTTTVNVLRSLRVPADAYYRTPPVETTVWSVTAQLVEMKVEADSDVHLVIADPATGNTMIVEFPSDGCTGATLPAIRPKIRAARKALLAACGSASTSGFRRLEGTATISGVGFFDKIHGQSGVAPNGIEIHPVLSFIGRCSGG